MHVLVFLLAPKRTEAKFDRVRLGLVSPSFRLLCDPLRESTPVALPFRFTRLRPRPRSELNELNRVWPTYNLARMGSYANVSNKFDPTSRQIDVTSCKIAASFVPVWLASTKRGETRPQPKFPTFLSSPFRSIPDPSFEWRSYLGIKILLGTGPMLVPSFANFYRCVRSLNFGRNFFQRCRGKFLLRHLVREGLTHGLPHFSLSWQITFGSRSNVCHNLPETYEKGRGRIRRLSYF